MQLTGLFEVLAVKKKTRAKFFKNLTQGDVIFLEFDISTRLTGASNGIYVPTITVVNLKTNEEANFTYHNLLNRMECFELLQIDMIIDATGENMRGVL